MFDFLLLFESFEFEQPWWLLGVFLPIFVAILLRIKRQNLQQTYADAHLWHWVNAASGALQSCGFFRCLLLQLTPLRFLALGWILIVVALSNPRELIWRDFESKSPAMDVVVVLDVSPSMAAEDVFPNCFTQAKWFLESLERELPDETKLGLVAFSGQAHVISPLSVDRQLFLHYLNLLSADFLSTRGSALELGVAQAIHHLQQLSQQASHRPAAIVMVTDGRGAESAIPMAMPEHYLQSPVYRQLFVERNLAIANFPESLLVIGVGDQAPVVLKDEAGNALQSSQGGLANVALSESFMRRFAQTVQGDYVALQTSASFVQQIAQRLQARNQTTQVPQQRWQSYADVCARLGAISLLIAFFGFSLRWPSSFRQRG